MKEIKDFIRFHLKNSKIGAVLSNVKDIVEPITESIKNLTSAVENKSNDIANTDDITNPIVEAQKETTEAIKSIPSVDIPKTDLSTVESKLDALNETLSKKDLSVNVEGTKVDTKSIVKAIGKLEKLLPKLKPEEQKDYSELLSKVISLVEENNKKDFSDIKKVIDRISTTKDLEVVCQYLENLTNVVDSKEVLLPLDKDGRIKVNVDKVGGGGGVGFTKIETDALVNISETVATESKQDDIIEAINSGLSNYLTQAVDDYTTTSVTYVCKMKTDGAWLFMKIDETGDFMVITYANVSNNATMTTYALAYASRDSLTYETLNNLTL